MYEVSDELKALLESGVAVLVGTGDNASHPRVDYGWGPRLRPDRLTIDVFLDTARAGRALANLKVNPKIAMTVADVVSYRSVQLKGTFRETRAANDGDHAWVQQRREAFLSATSLIGDPPDLVRNLWLDDILCVTFVVEAAFDQTPGPGAGRPL